MTDCLCSQCCDITLEVRAREEAVGEIRRHGASLTPAQDSVGASTPFAEDDGAHFKALSQ